MYSGGIADKLGNRYEAKILVHKLLDVVTGELDWVRFEGVAKEFQGFEFAVGKDSKVDWFQTKINASHGNWTIPALKREGVLDAFTKRLDASEDNHCYFISQNPADDLYRLSEKARIANDADEFIASLEKSHTIKFTDLSKDWNSDKDSSFHRLRRTYFQTFPEKEIEVNIRTKAKFIFAEWGEDVFSVLRDYMEDNLNKVISTETIRKYLNEKHIGFKDWTLNPTLKKKLSKQTERYLRTYIPFGVGGVKIERKETTELLEEIDKPKGARVTLLTGTAGSGKSGIVRALIEYLEETEISHLAFRVDQHLDCKTPEQIGSELLERAESPVTTLHGVSQGNPSVLIVDQVDAVSEVSGRKGAVKNAILEMLDELRVFDTKIVLVCRDFDLDSDSRLKALEGRQLTKRIKVGLLNWEEDIAPTFEAKNIDIKTFTEGQKKLLTLPLNLSLYLEIGEENLEFDNREDLFGALIKKKERDLHGRGLGWKLLEPLIQLANWMSDKQKLSAPAYILDDFSQATDLLFSEGLIVHQDKSVNFFHESFFDYIYARAFLRSEQSITDLLLSTEQHLFRRTQVRQILEVLRQYDRSRYLVEIEGLFKLSKSRSYAKNIIEKLPASIRSCTYLASFKESAIRYHIRIAIATWLGSIKDPIEQERKIGLSLDKHPEGYSAIARSILFGSAGWFDLHVKSDWIMSTLNGDDDARKNFMLWWLLRKAHERPEGIAKIFREWWANKPERALELIQGSIQITTKGMEDKIEPIETLYCDLIDSQPEGMFSDSTAHNRDFILNTWVNENAKRGSKVLKAYLNCWFETHPGDHPFSRDHFSDLDIHSLSEAAKKSPSELISGFLEALNKSVELIKQKKSRGEWDSTFESIHEGDCYGDDKFTQLFRNAFKDISKDNPELARTHLANLDPENHKVFLHFHLETISANPEFFKDDFIKLLGNENLLKAGFNGVEWKSFANVARETMPYLSDEDRLRVEAVIKGHTPELDRAHKLVHEDKGEAEKDKGWILHCLNNSGREQWYILENIGSDYLSSEMQVFFLQLQRKFKGQNVAESRSFRGGIVKSPISLEHAKFMSDEQWHRAIEKYNSDDDREYQIDCVIGGADQLASVLTECTKQNPDRFAKLLLQIPASTNRCYPGGILYGLREVENCDLESLNSVIQYADQYQDKPFGQEISGIIRRHTSLCKEQKNLDLLLWYARNGTANDNIVPSQENKKIVEGVHTIEDVINRTECFFTSGINDVRGAAAWAFSRAYWEFPNYSEVVESLLEERIGQEPLTSARCVLVELLFPFYNYDREKCGQFLEQLVAQNPDQEFSNAILTSQECIRLLQYILANAPDSGRKLVSRLIESEDRKDNLIGAWLVFGASYQREEYGQLYNKLVKQGVEYERLASQVAADFFSVSDLRDKAIKRIMMFFNDKDEHVRKNATHVFRKIKPNEIDQYRDLIELYFKSKAFAGDTFDFLRLLTEAEPDVHEYVIKAAEQIFRNVRNEGSSQQYSRDHFYLEELLEKEYSASEGNSKLRERFLDIIDSMLELEIHGGEKIVRTHERHH